MILHMHFLADLAFIAKVCLLGLLLASHLELSHCRF